MVAPKTAWILLLVLPLDLACNSNGGKSVQPLPGKTALQETVDQGKQIFRSDTFGDEAFWGGALKLHEAILGQSLGGKGDGVSPATALAVGLKVDSEALPAELAGQLRAGQVNLEDPATTVALLKLEAVVGLKGIFDQAGTLTGLGITCAFCHSTVDDSFSPGIGKRLDGWPNRDLDVGKIISLSPDLSAVNQVLGTDDATTRSVLAAWGPGKFDAELFLDGKGFRPDGTTAATLLPPAYGLSGVNLHTFTGWGSVPYWNAFVAIIEMHGVGNFWDPRLADATKFPVAARNGFAHIQADNDQVSAKLAPLHLYQLSLPVPRGSAGSFDAEAAKRGQAVFKGAARCASCHVPPLYTEPGWNLRTPAEIGIDDFQANRGPEGRYRTTPLRGLQAHSKGGFYHDGRFKDLAEVVDHYDRTLSLGLTPADRSDLIEFLKSL